MTTTPSPASSKHTTRHASHHGVRRHPWGWMTGYGYWRGPLPLRWVYFHVLRELAQHCGHADILRLTEQAVNQCLKAASVHTG